MTDALRYPIGLFSYERPYTPAERQALLLDLENLPGQLRRAVADLSETQLDTRYRPGGWTVRQVTHHVADSHLNGYTRTKLALTEANPSIKPYEEQLWAELQDTFTVPVATSLALLDALHTRWVAVFRSLGEADFLEKTFYHPAAQQTSTLDRQLGNYAWHGRHHLAHVTSLREREGW